MLPLNVKSYEFLLFKHCFIKVVNGLPAKHFWLWGIKFNATEILGNYLKSFRFNHNQLFMGGRHFLEDDDIGDMTER